MTIINYKDLNIENLSFDKCSNLVYNDNLFLLKTNYITINSELIKRNNETFIEFLINDINSENTGIFIKKINDINDKIVSIKKPDILYHDENKIKILCKLSMSKNKLKTKIFHQNKYVTNIQKLIKPNNRCCLILFINIENDIPLEIIEMKIDEISIPKNELNLRKQNSMYLELDSELDNILEIINS